MFFQDPYLNEIACSGPFVLKTYRFQEIVILKNKGDESHGRFFLGNVHAQNSDTFEVEHSLLHSTFIICRYGFHFRSTDLVD